ncbi:anthranilate phosphoribosyltransferase [Sphingosinicella rhizophila]|uniref:Anthranilate phosphoribosyltransferase n=1 Tax=Sphingosinicella rhizophila TaxID=3050082 RepID=A0ABU3Q329_9SPHN|nr:anthranilate phosphoribosyltransferase [Sphingosinicella sp. GR2756]MDT9597388.1 anthranilate phosphoribosyltransferase [Sphingosinicella sp. GR2756]
MPTTSNVAPSLPLPTIDTEGPDRALSALYDGHSLNQDESETLFEALVQGRLSEPVIAAMLVSLRLKGETADELIGAGRALRAADEDFERPDYLFADSCGTGGDGSGSINVSTAAAFVCAAAGLPVAKHGNRSFSSRCGSADVLEHLGAKLDINPAASRRALDEAGICFLFAPFYHPGLRHAGPVRRQLKIRTIMNILGPCLNPAEPPVQLLGVADTKFLEPVAATLAALGVGRALVVHGSGLDEVALHGETQAVSVRNGTFERLVLTPEQGGLARAPIDVLKGGDPEENAERFRLLLLGRAGAAETQMVALNAGALLMTAGLAADLKEGVGMANEAIASGGAHKRLAMFVDATHA